MSAVTDTHAIPYAEPGDPVAEGGAAIQAIALRVDKLLGERGSTSVTFTADTNTTKRVNYARDYNGEVPLAFAGLNSTAGGQVTFWTTGHDDTGFTLGVRADYAATHTVNWHCRF